MSVLWEEPASIEDYWTTIRVAAEQVRRTHSDRIASLAAPVVGAGLLIGTLWLPLFGTILGFGTSLFVILFAYLIAGNRADKLVFANVLSMTKEAGEQYAKLLYEFHGCKYIPSLYLTVEGGVLLQPWDFHYEQIQPIAPRSGEQIR
jgi:hypothetical protein